MKKNLFIVVLVFGSLLGSSLFTSCEEENPGNNDTIVLGDTSIVVITENISENTTLSKGKTYILAGRIAVLSGVTLTIEPGVIIKGQAGTGPNATALLIARGGKLRLKEQLQSR